MYTGFLLNKSMFLKNLQIVIYYVYHKNEKKKTSKQQNEEWKAIK
jgi:predicted glycosyltransferase involved in capsule biosynthesis